MIDWHNTASGQIATEARRGGKRAVQCRGITARGKRCERIAWSGRHCPAHKSQLVRGPTPPRAVVDEEVAVSESELTAPPRAVVDEEVAVSESELPAGCVFVNCTIYLVKS